MTAPAMSDDFTPDQKCYLEGFVSGMQSARTARGLGPLGGAPGGAPAKPAHPPWDALGPAR